LSFSDRYNVQSPKAQKKCVFPVAQLAPTLILFTADCAIVSLTMVTMGFDKKKKGKKAYLPTLLF
jgi:hypothetical protein